MVMLMVAMVMVWMGRRRTGEEDEEEERCHMWHGLVLGRPGLIAGPCGHRGARWRRLAGVVGDLEAIFGLLGCILPLPWRHIGAILGRRWDILATLGGGAYWAYWKLLGESDGFLGAVLGDVWAVMGQYQGPRACSSGEGHSLLCRTAPSEGRRGQISQSFKRQRKINECGFLGGLLG